MKRDGVPRWVVCSRLQGPRLPQSEKFTSASHISCVFSFFFFSLVYQSLRFRNYFYVPSSKAGPRDDACAVYIAPSRVLRAKRMCSLWTLNLSIAIDQILEQ